MITMYCTIGSTKGVGTSTEVVKVIIKFYTSVITTTSSTAIVMF